MSYDLKCTICLDSCFADLSLSLSALSCGHIYHRECILKWTSSTKTCPTCRKSIKSMISHLFLHTETSSSQLTNSSSSNDETLQLLRQSNSAAHQKIAELKTSSSALSKECEFIKSKCNEFENLFTNERARKLQLHYKMMYNKIKEDQTELIKIKTEYDRIKHTEVLIHGTDEEINALRSEIASQDKDNIWLVLQSLRRQLDIKNSKIKCLQDQCSSLMRTKALLSEKNVSYAAQLKRYASKMELSDERNKKLHSNNDSSLSIRSPNSPSSSTIDTPKALSAPTPDRPSPTRMSRNIFAEPNKALIESVKVKRSIFYSSPSSKNNSFDNKKFTLVSNINARKFASCSGMSSSSKKIRIGQNLPFK